MPTEKPRLSFALPVDLRERIEAFRFDHRKRNISQAVIELLEKGLEVLEAENAQKEQPVTMDGLTEQELEFMDTFDALNPQNQRLLLGIGALILQEQAKPPD